MACLFIPIRMDRASFMMAASVFTLAARTRQVHSRERRERDAEMADPGGRGHQASKHFNP